MTTLIGLVASAAYLPILGFGVYFARPSASERDLQVALRLYLTAALVQFVRLGAAASDVQTSGSTTALSVFNLTLALLLTALTARRVVRKAGAR